MTTVREAGADICPKCDRHMEIVKQESAKTPDGDPCIVIAYICKTEGCRWEGTGRAVQTDLRGNVFERAMGPRGMDKDFKPMTNEALSRGKAIVENYLGHRIEDDNNIPGSRQNDELPPDAV